MLPTVIDAPYVYQYCPACDMPIRFTLGVEPDGQLRYVDGSVARGLSLHLRTSCEARPR